MLLAKDVSNELQNEKKNHMGKQRAMKVFCAILKNRFS